MAEVTLEALSREVAAALHQDQQKTRQGLEALLHQIRESLQQGQAIHFPEIGTLGADEAERVDLARLGESISQQGDLSREAAQQLIGHFFEGFRRHLLSGNALKFQGLASFCISHQRPKIVRESKGHKLIAPAVRAFEFEPAPELARGKQAPAFELDEQFRLEMETPLGRNILMAVPERDIFARTLEYFFSKAGWNVVISLSAVDAIQRLDTLGTYLVIIDARVKNWGRLTETIKCTRETSLVPIISIFPFSIDPDFIGEFIVIGDEHIREPFEVHKMLSLAESELIRCSEEELIFDQQVSFQYPTDDSNLDRANELGHRLFEASGLSEEGQIALAAAFREAIGNAAQHGNKYRKDKVIRVLYLLDHEKITINVKDEGQGFDHERYVVRGKAGDAITAARERHQEGKLGGLGIMLMLKCTDRLEYNDVGNSITLTKMIDR